MENYSQKPKDRCSTRGKADKYQNADCHDHYIVAP